MTAPPSFDRHEPGSPRLTHSRLASERLRILEALRSDLRHDFNSPLGLVKANLDVMEDLATGLTRWVDRMQAAGAPLADHPDPRVAGLLAEARSLAESLSLDLLVESLASLVDGAQAQTRRALKTADALLQFCTGDEAGDWADVNREVERALSLVRGRLKYRFEIESRLALPVIVPVASQELLHVLVVLLLRAADQVSEPASLSVGSAVAGAEVVLEIEAGGGPPDDASASPARWAWPALDASEALLKARGGRLEACLTPGGCRYTLRLPIQPLGPQAEMSPP